jgi:thiamine kinase-like enzyme
VAGVSPEIVHFGGDGVMVTRLVDGAMTMSPELFRQTPGAVKRAALAFRQLHDRAPAFEERFDLFQHMDNYQALLKKLGTALPEDYDQFVSEAEVVRSALAAHPVPQKSCHCDPLCENFLDTGDRMWIVDWEYSGTNDPMWDLGDLSVEAGLSAEQEKALLETYFGGPARAADHGRLIIYKAMCDLLWTLWGLIQHANGNPAENFHAYALNRFERCKAVMRSPDFQSHIEAVRRG